jgi:hypothetical protein
MLRALRLAIVALLTFAPLALAAPPPVAAPRPAASASDDADKRKALRDHEERLNGLLAFKSAVEQSKAKVEKRLADLRARSEAPSAKGTFKAEVDATMKQLAEFDKLLHDVDTHIDAERDAIAKIKASLATPSPSAAPATSARAR